MLIFICSVTISTNMTFAKLITKEPKLDINIFTNILNANNKQFKNDFIFFYMFYFFFLSLSFFRQQFINHIIKLSMLEKYEDFFKISRNEECNIYTGICRETGQHVLLKRHKKSKNSWDEVLKSRSLQFTQKSKMFPKMVEIFKNKADYYVVFDKPTGPNLANADLFGPLSL